MPKIEPFEKYTQKYEDWFERNKFAYESELLAIKELMPKNGKGIEIGVGSGKFAEPLGIRLGIEPSPKMRGIAEKREIEVIDASAEELPFNDNKFTFALMVTTICFLDNIEAAFKEAYRILKSDGSLIVGFVDKQSLLGKLYQNHKMENVFYKAATFYSTEEVIFNLIKAGFRKFVFNQTIFHKLPQVNAVEPVRPGYGKGSFVVVKAMKWSF